MDKQELIKFFSEFWKLEPAKVNDGLMLSDREIKNFSSIKMFQFFAQLESRYKVKINNIHEIVKFGDLFNNIK